MDGHQFKLPGGLKGAFRSRGKSPNQSALFRLQHLLPQAGEGTAPPSALSGTFPRKRGNELLPHAGEGKARFQPRGGGAEDSRLTSEYFITW